MLVFRWARNAAKLITSGRDEVAQELAAGWRRRGIPLKFGMLHAEVQRERAQAVGVTEFVWRTQGDDRVRDVHREPRRAVVLVRGSVVGRAPGVVGGM